MPICIAMAFFALAGWGAAISAMPQLRDGSQSADFILLATAMFGALFAADAFARDTGLGRLEFLYSSGASPSALFAARTAIVLLGTALIPAALYTFESLRLFFLFDGTVSRNWMNIRLHYLQMNPREVLLIYILPGFALFLFVSSISSRTATALVAGTVFTFTIGASEAMVIRKAEAMERLSVAEAVWTLALIPACAALAALAVRVRRREPERTPARFALLAASFVILILRFFSVQQAAAPDHEKKYQIAALAVSPDRETVAVEARCDWRPDPWMIQVAGAVGRPIEDKDYHFASRVSIGSIREAPREIAPSSLEIDRAREFPSWMNPGHLRVRGLRPDAAESDDVHQIESLVYDLQSKRLLSSPTNYIIQNDDARAQELWTMEACASSPSAPCEMIAKRFGRDGDFAKAGAGGEIELCKLRDGRRLIIKNREQVIAVDDSGNATTLWPVRTAR